MDVPEVRSLYIFGAGGFGREIAVMAAECFHSSVQLTFVVDAEYRDSGPVGGLPVTTLEDVDTRDAGYVVAIGDSAVRRRASQECEAVGLTATTLVHPSARVGAVTDIGAGTLICPGVIMTTDIRLGRHVHLNLDCTIGHDARIEDFATLSPGCHVSGNVVIEADTFVGTGANFINGSPGHPLVVGAGAVVAAGSCVTRSVEPGALVAGVPAVRKR